MHKNTKTNMHKTRAKLALMRTSLVQKFNDSIGLKKKGSDY